MKTLVLKYSGLESAVASLIAHAPAQCDYWGVKLRAKYATTRAVDVLARYYRIIAEQVASYGDRLPKAQRARMVCGDCGAKNCKMWREYQTFANHTKILCGPCALKDQEKEGPIDADGKIGSDFGKCDQIGWLVPAVPDVEGHGFWGYTSVPSDGVGWWKALPSYPEART